MIIQLNLQQVLNNNNNKICKYNNKQPDKTNCQMKKENQKNNRNKNK